jgi:hypothetical protein
MDGCERPASQGAIQEQRGSVVSKVKPSQYTPGKISALPNPNHDNSDGSPGLCLGMDEHTVKLISWAVMALATLVIVVSAYLILRNRL